MPRILIIAEDWPQRAPGAALLAKSAIGAGYDAAIICSEDSRMDGLEDVELIRVPREPLKSGGRLFALSNALFFDSAANPGNYAVLRDTLHQHLQEVLYDAVVILCPPQIYLRLAYWIDLSFGIPVWLHLAARLKNENPGSFHRWNHARLRRKYLGAAKLITVEHPEDSATVKVQDYQRKMLAILRSEGIDFVDEANNEAFQTAELLDLIIRRKPRQ